MNNEKQKMKLLAAQHRQKRANDAKKKKEMEYLPYNFNRITKQLHEQYREKLREQRFIQMVRNLPLDMQIKILEAALLILLKPKPPPIPPPLPRPPRGHAPRQPY